MQLTSRDLPAFVDRSDQLGGPEHPDCAQYWQGIEYRPGSIVDQSLDPFSEEYVSQQISLYREISGREFDQLSNEHTALDVAHHVEAINPYDHVSPGGLAQHLERLSRALRFAMPPRGSRMLDMGCGWGLSSEIAAYCGLAVTAVDVNSDFVDLVNRRAARSGYNIVAQHGTFDSFESDDRFSIILFYECFHHALRPWDVLARMARHLTPNGHIILAGEPINDVWWENWGLRLDPLSLYCIHKFGWLESGWSADFLKAAFLRAGLAAQIATSPESDVGFTVIGSRPRLGRVGAQEIGGLWKHSGWVVDGEYMTSLGDSRLALLSPSESRTASLGLRNFRPKPLNVVIRSHQGVVATRDLQPGLTEVEIEIGGRTNELFITSELWNPDIEIGNGDNRPIGFHLEQVTFF